MNYIIKADEIYLENEVLKNGAVVVKDGIIIEISNNIDNVDEGYEVIDLKELKLLPGFLDIHIHGGNGKDVMDLSYESINKISEYKLGEGVTSFCPTTVTASYEDTKTAVVSIKEAVEKGCTGAEILGGFLEGPYINPEYKGAHNEKLIREINMDEIKELYEIGEGTIKSFAIAPEKENGMEAIKFLAEKGINVRLGHSGATFKKAYEAQRNGASIAIHTYNAMRAFNHREAGMVGATMLNDGLYAEIICDMEHVSKEGIQILLKMKPADKVILITDCMMAGGLPEGDYNLGSLPVTMKEGTVRTETGALAGSILTINKAVENVHEIAGASFSDAVNMASINPARAIGVDDRKGSISINKDADLIGMDKDYNIKFVMTKGKIRKK